MMQMVTNLYAIDANGCKTLCDGCTGLENITERLQMVSEHYEMLKMVAKHSALIAISF